MRLLVLAALLLAGAPLTAPAVAQGPGAPTVTTGPAESIGRTSATLTGSVDSGGSATGYRFEYGTTTAYGLTTDELPPGDGNGPVTVRAELEGLTPSTTYHFRLVAGGQTGADATFTTAAAPEVPVIAQLRAVEKTASSARLTARVNPKGADTTVHFEWGTSAALGNLTAPQVVRAGRRRVAIAAAIAGLPARRRIHWRVVAANEAGVRHGPTATFTTLRALTGATLDVFPAVATWGDPVSISGRVDGAGVNGVAVLLEQATFPFDAGFQPVATTTSNRLGVFRFPARPVLVATRFRVVTRNATPVSSSVVSARVRPRVAIRATGKTRRSLRLHGEVQPGALAGARANLQRRTRLGGWTSARRGTLRADEDGGAGYRFYVRRGRRVAVYRVKVPAVAGGAHLAGYSRTLLVGRAKPRKRQRPARHSPAGSTSPHS